MTFLTNDIPAFMTGFFTTIPLESAGQADTKDTKVHLGKIVIL
jgi:hypothetical protein